ncbi:MAG: hypothetical protein HAW67_04870, partial [Endozoicomonadaceae bacterium]|nr:hypothetical protein [Endozoicomonadaceae bacterium]
IFVLFSFSDSIPFQLPTQEQSVKRLSAIHLATKATSILAEIDKKVGELKKNMKVRLYDIEYELIDNLGRKGWSVRSLKDKQIYQMMKKQVLAAKIVE